MIESGYYTIDAPVVVREDFYIVAVYIPSELEDNNAIMFGSSMKSPAPYENLHATYFDYPHRYSDNFAPEEMVTFDSISKYSRGELFINSGLVEFVSSDHTNTIYPDAIYGCKFTGKHLVPIEEATIIEHLQTIRRTWGV